MRAAVAARRDDSPFPRVGSSKRSDGGYADPTLRPSARPMGERAAPAAAAPRPKRHLPRDVFFFFVLTAFPFAAACFCFFFAGILNLPVSRS